MAKKTKKLEVKDSVLEWCREQVKQGKQLTMHWEGGGDSGWVYFQIDGEQVENEYTSYLVDMMYSELDYGSWAGEFSATGEATFNLEENAFVGIDYYSEDETISFACDMEVRIPKNLWFDSVTIQIEADSDESSHVDVSFNIKNGFLTDEHGIYASKVEDILSEKVNEVVDEFVNAGNEYRGVWDNMTIEKSEWEENDQHLVYNIKELDIRTATTQDKSIYLEITEEDIINESENDD